MSDIAVARLVGMGQPLEVGRAAKPAPGPREVLVKVAACGLVPNMTNILRGHPHMSVPSLPGIVGLDVSGTIEAVGAEVLGLSVGQRVYVDPYLTCGTCSDCRRGRRDFCSHACLRGYMSWTPDGEKLLNRYEHGGFSEYVVSPDTNIVRLPDSIDFLTASRFGYLGTSFGALRMGGIQSGQVLLINGVTGTLGVAATAMALGMGAIKVLGIGRNPALLDQVRQLAPGRVETLRAGEGDPVEWVLGHTGGRGADLLYDCLGYGGDSGSTTELLHAVRKGGPAVLVSGGVPGDVSQKYYEILNSDVHLRGSVWFSHEDIDRMTALIGAGVIDLSWLEHRVFPLAEVNDALAMIEDRPGGFVNIVVQPGS